MPSRDEHIRLATKFSLFLDQAKSLSQIEIAIAVCYWRSLHYIDAILADRFVNVHPPNDAERFEAMRKDAKFKKFFQPYRNLKDRAAEAMYQARVFTSIDFEDDFFADAEEIRKAAERILGI